MIIDNKTMREIMVILYFTCFLCLEIIANNAIVKGLSYIVFLLAVFVEIRDAKQLKAGILLISIVGTLCGIVACCVNGNVHALNLIYMTFSIYIAMLMLDKSISNKLYGYITIVTALVITALILKNGVSNEKFFIERSVNYISIFLMLSMCLYYARADLYEEKYSLVPAIIAFVLSCIAGGRGGFLATAILVVPLVLIKYFSKKRTRTEKILLCIFLLIVLLAVAYPILLKVIHNERFLLVNNFHYKAKLTDSYRYYCWKEYIDCCKRNIAYLLFGAPINELDWAKVLLGNLHSSYFAAHAFYGITGILFILFFSVNAVIFSMKNSTWVYCFSFLSFSIRAITDYIFPANRMSPMYLALLLAPYIIFGFRGNKYTCFSDKYMN